MKSHRWFPRASVEEPRRFEVDTTSRRSGPAPGTTERTYSITINVEGAGGVSVPWEGTSFEDVRDSFLEFLYNHDEFGIASTDPQRYFRSLRANFNGKIVLVTFRTSWLSAFTIS